MKLGEEDNLSQLKGSKVHLKRSVDRVFSSELGNGSPKLTKLNFWYWLVVANPVTPCVWFTNGPGDPDSSNGPDGLTTSSKGPGGRTISSAIGHDGLDSSTTGPDGPTSLMASEGPDFYGTG
ncbi:hypothetical protein Taro_010505 [Colocasia esculenta]|uniref:Uncharacterized protein n=1 Tax=Colocasia esculenta TaxID=4460 RepID=A0A843U9R7_COLES|nr:hypothetical protein [Colocasia esculenta]